MIKITTLLVVSLFMLSCGEGVKGKDGASGKDGTEGKAGLDGVNGKDGVNGEVGQSGDNGKNGVDGKDGLNGLDGKDGIDGNNGKDSFTSITKTIRCSGSLANNAGYDWSPFVVSYKVQQIGNGDVFVQGSIADRYSEVNVSTFYSFKQAGSIKAPVLLVKDSVGSASYGYWIMELNRETLVTTISYNDSVSFSSPVVWFFAPTQCIINEY